jgi:hypothetical protein
MSGGCGISEEKRNAYRNFIIKPERKSLVMSGGR